MTRDPKVTPFFLPPFFFFPTSYSNGLRSERQTPQDVLDARFGRSPGSLFPFPFFFPLPPPFHAAENPSDFGSSLSASRAFFPLLPFSFPLPPSPFGNALRGRITNRDELATIWPVAPKTPFFFPPSPLPSPFFLSAKRCCALRCERRMPQLVRVEALCVLFFGGEKRRGGSLRSLTTRFHSFFLSEI